MAPSESDSDRLELLLSIQRSRAQHWLEDHPEPWRPKTLFEHIVYGFDLLFGFRTEPEPAHVVLDRCWAKATVKTCDDIAQERGLSLRLFSRKDLPWWEAMRAVKAR